jgi:hypothetical protein
MPDAEPWADPLVDAMERYKARFGALHFITFHWRPWMEGADKLTALLEEAMARGEPMQQAELDRRMGWPPLPPGAYV